MSDLPAGVQPVAADERDLADPDLEDLEENATDEAAGEDADGDGGHDEVDEIDEPEAPRPQDVGRRGARGRPNGAVIREIQSQLEAERARTATFEQQLQSLLAERNQPRQPSQAEILEQQRREREMFESMSPYEQYQFTQNKIEERVRANTQQFAFSLWEQNDRRSYEETLERNPAYRKFDAKVEELRRQAPNVERRVLLATAIGMQALDQNGAARTRAARASDGVRERNGARPSQARGDVPAARSRRGDDLEERLRGQSI